MTNLAHVRYLPHYRLFPIQHGRLVDVAADMLRGHSDLVRANANQYLSHYPEGVLVEAAVLPDREIENFTPRWQVVDWIEPEREYRDYIVIPEEDGRPPMFLTHFRDAMRGKGATCFVGHTNDHGDFLDGPHGCFGSVHRSPYSTGGWTGDAYPYHDWPTIYGKPRVGIVSAALKLYYYRTTRDGWKPSPG